MTNSVQYPYFNDVSAWPKSISFWAFFFSISSSVKLLIFSPLITSKAPSNKTTRPLPPASTTSASFKTSSFSGVLSKEMLAASITFVKNYSKLSYLFCAFKAKSAVSLPTVKIVPSTGFITAL